MLGVYSQAKPEADVHEAVQLIEDDPPEVDSFLLMCSSCHALEFDLVCILCSYFIGLYTLF